MAEQPRLDVFERQRHFEQRIVLQIDLPDRQIVRGAPIPVHRSEQGRGKGPDTGLSMGARTRVVIKVFLPCRLPGRAHPFGGDRGR